MGKRGLSCSYLFKSVQNLTVLKYFKFYVLLAINRFGLYTLVMFTFSLSVKICNLKLYRMKNRKKGKFECLEVIWKKRVSIYKKKERHERFRDIIVVNTINKT